jgi:acyl-CoA thioesterase FadM
MFNANGQLLNKGYVTLVFLNKETKKPVLAPDWFLNECKKFF